MKRSAQLRRKTPLKRSKFRRSAPRATDHPMHLAHLRTLPCCLYSTGEANDCRGPVHSHHSTASKGMSLRTSDLDAFPFCEMHHAQFHAHAGYFEGWTKDERRAFQQARSAEYRPRELEEAI